MVIDLDRPARAAGGEYRPPTTKANQGVIFDEPR
jgi:hypothetical protein